MARMDSQSFQAGQGKLGPNYSSKFGIGWVERSIWLKALVQQRYSVESAALPLPFLFKLRERKQADAKNKIVPSAAELKLLVRHFKLLFSPKHSRVTLRGAA